MPPFYTNEALVYRQEGAGNKNQIPVPVEKIVQSKAQEAPMANDILRIPAAKGKRLTKGMLEKTALGAAAM